MYDRKQQAKHSQMHTYQVSPSPACEHSGVRSHREEELDVTKKLSQHQSAADGALSSRTPLNTRQHTTSDIGADRPLPAHRVGSLLPPTTCSLLTENRLSCKLAVNCTGGLGNCPHIRSRTFL